VNIERAWRAQGAIACLDLPAEAFWRGHAIYLKAQHHLILGELDAAHQAAHELRSLGQSIEDRRLQAYGHILLAIETMMRGDAGAALAMAHEALEIASEKPPPTSEGSTRSSLVRLRP
jgi:hypothetical protein